MAALRQLRRKFLPFLPSGATARLWRTRCLRRLGYARARAPVWLVDHPQHVERNLLRYVAADAVARRGELAFLQVGAFDGEADDDLRAVIDAYPCRGILVEPQPGAFARLQETYGAHPRLQLLNVAIDRESGERPFYTTKNRRSVVASFDRGHLRKHGVAEADIVCETIRCLTIADVLGAAGWQHLDLLQIDAEGYDGEILRSLDLNRVRPAIIRFEFAHFTRRELDACLARLASHGYAFLTEDKDVIAVGPATSAKQAHVA